MLRAEQIVYAHQHQGAHEHYRYTLDADTAEVVAILGPSGSGKSTFLDIIAGFLMPLSGSLTFDGNDLIPLPPDARPVTILFQHHNLFEHLTAAQNVLIGLRGDPRGTPDEQAQVSALLERMGIADRADRIVTALSGGEQQRVALARALLRRRPVLLLDEPFAGLDTRTRGEMLRLVRTLTDTYHLHTLMVTHDPADADAIADRIYRMTDRELISAN